MRGCANTTRCIDLLLRLERVLKEEWNDVLEQMLPLPHTVGHTIAMIGAHDTALEEVLQGVQQLYIAFVLHDGEFWEYLVTQRHLRMTADGHVEAPFTIHKTCNPLRLKLHRPAPNVKSLRVLDAVRVFPADCPRVRWIFTALAGARTSTRRLCEEFPAYSSVLLRLASLTLGPL